MSTTYEILRQFVNTKEPAETTLGWIKIFNELIHPYFNETLEERLNWFNFRYEYDYLRRYRDGSCEKERRIYQVLCKEVGRYKKETGTCEQIFKIGKREFRYKPQDLYIDNEQSAYVSSKARTISAINSIYGVVANRRHGDI